MKNTKQKGKLRFLIYGSKHDYIGICYEIGMVEQGNSIEQVKHRLMNGAKAILETCVKENLPNNILNTRPPLKYTLIFYGIPFVVLLTNFISQIRELFSFDIFEKNISELKLAT